MSELVHLNGSLVPREQARVSAFDYGFLYGYGLFETMRAYSGRVFRIDRHLERLARSAATLGIEVEPAGLKDAVEETLRANGLVEARVRLAVSIGEGGAQPDLAGFGEPTVLVVATPHVPVPDDVRCRGFRAVVSSIRRNSRSPLSGMKTASYLESLLARQAARSAGVDETICLNERGLVAEASMSNIFIVAGGVLRTPGLAGGVLPGITREAVLNLGNKSGVPALEDDITLEELLVADEAFLTNSVMEIMPLTQVDGRPLGSGQPGPLTARLAAAYGELVRRETAG